MLLNLKFVATSNIVLSGTSITPYQTTYTSYNRNHSNTSNVNNLLFDDHILRIKQLENALVEARMKTRVSVQIERDKLKQKLSCVYINLGTDGRKPFIENNGKTA